MSRQGSVPLLADPAVGDAQAGDEADAAVDGDQLAVVAADPERVRQPGRIEDPGLDAGLAQAPPETGQGAEGRAEPVVEHAHANAGAGALDQGIREGPAGHVVGDDEVLEMDDLSAPERIASSQAG